MKHLILLSDDNEIFYDMKEINKIAFDYAQNLLDESEIHSNGYKPLEMLALIYFNDGGTATFHTAGLEMYFD